MITRIPFVAALALTINFTDPPRNLFADDWPMLGRDGTRNPVSLEKNPPLEWDVKTGRNIKWRSALGSSCFSTPVVANGLVWIGTNNYQPRDAKFTGPGGVLMCFRESDGKFLYQHISPEQKGPISRLGWVGITCSPLVEGNRLWFTTTLAEILCLDIGPFGQGSGIPQELWKLDEIKDLRIYPAQRSVMGGGPMCSIGASHGELIYAMTANGTDGYGKIPEPHAPALVCLNKKTGKVIWQDSSPSGGVILGERGHPLIIEVDGSAQVVAPQGDGWLRSFDALTGELIWKFDINPKNQPQASRNGGKETRLAFVNYTDGKVDLYWMNTAGWCERHGSLNPGERREQQTYAGHVWLARNAKGVLGVWEAQDTGGEAMIVNRPRGVDDPGWGIPFISSRNYFVSAPVLYEGKLYIGGGQDVEQGEGDGRLCCIDPGKRGDITLELDDGPAKGRPNPNSGEVWHFDDIGRMHATVAIHNGLVIAAGFSGIVYCLDAKTGRKYWQHDTKAHIRNSPLIVDEKVYVGDEDGIVHIFGLSQEKQVFGTIEMDGEIDSSPVFANGVLYVATNEYLYAIQEGHSTSSPPRESTGAKPDSRNDMVLQSAGSSARVAGAYRWRTFFVASAETRLNGIAVDAGGNVYVVGEQGSTIGKIAPDGKITIIAGTAGSPTSVDGTGAGAQFDLPLGLALGENGSLYFTELRNHAIRKISSSGLVTTFAGSRYEEGTADGTGGDTRFRRPSGLAVDGRGNLFIGDALNLCIRRVTPAGVVNTLAGLAAPGQVRLYNSGAAVGMPGGLVVDREGSIFYVWHMHHVIRKLSPDGTITTAGGVDEKVSAVDGSRTTARFQWPLGLAIDAHDDIYVTDASAVRKLSPDGTVTTIGGMLGEAGQADGLGSEARFTRLRGVAVSSAGVVYVTSGAAVIQGTPVR